MDEHDPPLGQPLGARGSDIIHAGLFQHRGAHQARVERQIEQRQRDRRQHQVVRNVPDPVPALVEGGDVLHSTGWEPAKIEGEYDDEHQPDPEQRRRIGHQGENRNGRVAPCIEAGCREQAKDNANADSKHDRAGHQQQGWDEAIKNEIKHRHVMPERISEIKSENVFQIDRKLHR